MMKLHKRNNTILNAADKFSPSGEPLPSPATLAKLDLTQLGELATQLLNDKNLEVSKVRPFFWSLVETYVDRFDLYPFDINKALFSYLELNDYPEETVLQLIKQLESQFQKSHGRPLLRPTPEPAQPPTQPPAQRLCQQTTLDDDIGALRDSIKYAVMVAESED